MQTQTKTKDPLTLLTIEQAKKELPAIADKPVEPEKLSKLEAQASQMIDDLLALSTDDLKRRQDYAHEVQNMGRAAQLKLVHKSNLLKEPMQILMTDLQDGGSVAQSLLNLQETINDINPNRYNFTMSGFRRLLSKIPGVGTVVSRWLVKFQAVEAIINDIIESLRVGQSRLERDNITLNNDQLEMNSLAGELRNYVEYGQIIDRQLTSRIESELNDEERKTFIQKDVLFPLRQRIIDLQQQLAVNQYGIVTSEAIIQNNKELIRGVDRALNVTVVAFQTASTLSVALEHQKTVLKGVEAINDTTNDLLLQTSKKLREQGATIQRQASSASIDTAVLKSAFENVDAALQEVNEFRVKALPELSGTIKEMDTINQQMEKSIDEFEASKEVARKFEISL
ncbi:MAG: toxic anion resistance protein [Arenicella sp.]